MKRFGGIQKDPIFGDELVKIPAQRLEEIREVLLEHDQSNERSEEQASGV